MIYDYIFNNMFDELEVVKYFKGNNRFQESDTVM